MPDSKRSTDVGTSAALKKVTISVLSMMGGVRERSRWRQATIQGIMSIVASTKAEARDAPPIQGVPGKSHPSRKSPRLLTYKTCGRASHGVTNGSRTALIHLQLSRWGTAAIVVVTSVCGVRLNFCVSRAVGVLFHAYHPQYLEYSNSTWYTSQNCVEGSLVGL